MRAARAARGTGSTYPGCHQILDHPLPDPSITPSYLLTTQLLKCLASSLAMAEQPGARHPLHSDDSLSPCGICASCPGSIGLSAWTPMMV